MLRKEYGLNMTNREARSFVVEIILRFLGTIVVLSRFPLPKYILQSEQG